MNLGIVVKAKLAQVIVNRILSSLSKSTLRDSYPGAYNMLVGLREDLEQDVMAVLNQKRWQK